jgi:hypothetical protein
MDSEKQREFGSWLGLQKAFAVVSGSCSAARAQCLKQVRDSHMLDDLGFTWDEFCKDLAGLSRQHADNIIRQYDHFGDAYFRLSEIARISPKNFQQIADKVTADAIEIGGQKLALIPENAHKIRVAIQALRNQTRRAPARPPAEVIELRVRLDSLAGDIAKSRNALDSTLDDASLRDLVHYAASKFRALARQFDARPQSEP